MIVDTVGSFPLYVYIHIIRGWGYHNHIQTVVLTYRDMFVRQKRSADRKVCLDH